MGINFVSNKCKCGGRLEYNQGTKKWICAYCGTEIEREATFEGIHVDGIEGINDVVRQTLSDIATGNLDSAKRNLDDCERKNHKHVGTLIANMSYNLAMMSRQKDRNSAREYGDIFMKYARSFKSEFPDIGPDEINLYESFGGSTADIFANLMDLYSTLKEEGRVEFVASKLNPSDIFSKGMNNDLLKVALKRSDFDTVEKIIANTTHIDRKQSLVTILEKYPDREGKTSLLDKLFDAQIAEELTKNYFEKYLTESGDGIDTKVYVIGKLAETSVRCSMAEVVKAVWSQVTDYNTARKLFNSVYSVVVKDRDTEEILAVCLEDAQRSDILAAFLDSLIEKKAYVKIDARIVSRFMDTTTMNVENTLGMLQRMFSFNLDNKAYDSIYNYYLNENHDEPDRRMQIIGNILWKNCSISVNTVKRYIVQTSTDAGYKPGVVQRLFDIGTNKTYLGDVLSEYMMKSNDDASVKKYIFDYLVSMGFKADAAVLLDYISKSTDTPADKTAHIKKLISNGTQLRPECLEAYIASVKQPQDFSVELFNILVTASNGLTADSFMRYLMGCKDADKARHTEMLLRASSALSDNRRVNVNYGGSSLTCNLLQAYALLTKDDYDMASNVVRVFVNSGIRFTDDILCDSTQIKFKKYAAGIRQSMSPLTLQLCEQNKVFSLF